MAAHASGVTRLLPPQADMSCEFHWLEFRGEFQLWRWHEHSWVNIYNVGAAFTPIQLADHGWRHVMAWRLPAAIASASVHGIA